MSDKEVQGYVVGISVVKFGDVPVTELLVVSTSGNKLTLYTHEVPDWLRIGSRIRGRYYEGETARGRLKLLEELKRDEALKPVHILSLEVEEVERTVDGYFMVSGKRDDGMFFSARLNPQSVTRQIERGKKFLGVFLDRDGIQVLLALVPLDDANIIRRAMELARELAKKSEERPELDYLKGRSNL